MDRNVLRLIKMWLRAPIEERDADETRRISGGKGNTAHAARRRRKSTAGQRLHETVPEALAFDRMRRHVPRSRRLLCRRLRYPRPRSPAEALAWTKAVMPTRVDDQRGENYAEKCRTGTLRLPRYSFGAHWFEANGKWYLGAGPSKKSVRRLKTEGRRCSGAEQYRSMAGST